MKDQDGFWKDLFVINLLSADSVLSTVQYTKVRRIPAPKALYSKRQKQRKQCIWELKGDSAKRSKWEGLIF